MIFYESLYVNINIYLYNMHISIIANPEYNVSSDTIPYMFYKKYPYILTFQKDILTLEVIASYGVDNETLTFGLFGSVPSKHSFQNMTLNNC